MAEPTSGGTSGSPIQPKKELPMELRLLLAFVLMGVVLFVTPYFYKTVSPPVKKTAPVAATTGPGTRRTRRACRDTANGASRVLRSRRSPTGRTSGGNPGRRYQSVSITFTNRGAVIKSWLLKKYKAHSGAPLELVNTAAHAERPMSLYFSAQKPAVDLNQALYEMHADADGLAVSFDYSNGQVAAHKSFQFRKSSYLLDVATEVTDGGKPIPHELEWRGGFGDTEATNPAGDQQTLYFDVTDSKLRKNGAKAAKDGPVTVTGNYLFCRHRG